MRKEELFEIISRLQDLSYCVVWNCCDMGNEGLGNSLEITIEKPFYYHPDFPDQRIYFFYDMPHLIKLCRNAIFNYGFILPDGTKVDKTTFAEIEKVVDAGGEIFGAFKLKNPKIFNVRSMDKQKVRLACQLLSKTMSDFIKMNFKGNAQI